MAFMVEAHTNTTLNSSKKKKKDKETKKLWGLKQNQKAHSLWHDDKRLWVGVYKVAEMQEVKRVSENTKKFCVLWERDESLKTMISRK